MITSHPQQRQFKAIWGMYSFPLVISILSAVQMVRYHDWLFLGVEMLALALLAGSISYLAKMTRQLGTSGENIELGLLITRAVFFTCAAYVLINLCSYIMLVVSRPS